MPAERDLNRCDFVTGFNDTDNTPHQEAIEALVFELSEAHQERREEDPEWWSRSDAQIQSLSDTIDLLCELRDGAARVHRPADNAPDAPVLLDPHTLSRVLSEIGEMSIDNPMTRADVEAELAIAGYGDDAIEQVWKALAR